MAKITTNDAAARLGITPRRVLAMIRAGRLKAARLGPIWTIDERQLATLADRRPGRPRKPAATG